MSETPIDAKVAYAKPGETDSGPARGARRRREPSARKLRAAALYASGKAKTLKAAIIEAGGSPTGVARVPGPKGWGSVELVRVDATYNPAPTPPAAMLKDGLGVLHGLAMRGESESVRAGSADRLVNHLKDSGFAAESNELTAADRFEAWSDLRQEYRRGIRAFARAVTRYGAARALEVLPEHERIEAEREQRRTPLEPLDGPRRVYHSGKADE